MSECKKLRMAGYACLAFISTSHAAEIYFDPIALESSHLDGNSPVDLTLLEKPGGQLPGVYQVQVRLNRDNKDSHALEFELHDGKLRPRLTIRQLENWGVATNQIQAFHNRPHEEWLTQALSYYIPGATENFDFSGLTLNITVPQIYMDKQKRGIEDPSRWEDGVSALFSNYAFRGANTRYNRNADTDSYFLSLTNGLNLGPWRLRHSATGSWSEQQGGHEKNTRTHSWRNGETVLMRDIAALRSRFAAGQTSTASGIFDSVPFTGVQLATEQSMWSDNQRNYAPVIRGIAGSSAQVTVEQNGNTIYKTWVPAGAFALDDLPSGGTNGDLLVTVREDSGKVNQFTVAYSSISSMLREGESLYAMSAGKYRQSGMKDEPEFGQLTFSYGFPLDFTGTGGMQIARDYQSGAAGLGVNLGLLGALSADVTGSRAELTDHQNKVGQSYRVQYSKSLLSTGSTVTLAAYRYSTEDFYTLGEYVQSLNQKTSDNFYRIINNSRRKNRLQLHLTQKLPGDLTGSLYITGLVQDYWDTGRMKEQSVSAGYNNSWQGVSYNVNYAGSKSQAYSTNHQVSLNVNIPLSRFLPSAWGSVSASSGSKGDSSYQAGVYGTVPDSNLSYSVNQSYKNHGTGNSGSMSLGYNGSLGDVNGSYNYSRDTKRIDYGLRGGALIHAGGLTLFPGISGKMTPAALVHVKGESGIGLTNSGVSTDWLGYAVVPSMSSFRRNSVAIDTQTLPDGIDIRDSIRQVTPTAGAIVMTDFTARRGQQAMLKLRTPEGRPVPFGAMISVQGDNANMSITGEDGMVYLSGLESSGTIIARWGNNRSCNAFYSLPVTDKARLMYQADVTCK
ncbi:fimbria/pilus outer membrane usher protein [Salmonella enterica]